MGDGALSRKDPVLSTVSPRSAPSLTKYLSTAFGICSLPVSEPEPLPLSLPATAAEVVGCLLAAADEAAEPRPLTVH